MLMRHYLRRFLFVLLLALLLFSLPLCAQAKEINRLYVWGGDVAWEMGDKLPDTAIQWYARGNTNRYLFLPSGIDTGNLRVYFTGSAKSFTVGDVTVNNGDTTDLLVPGTTVTIKNGNNTYKIIVAQSENTAGVYLSTKSGKIAYISESKKHRESGSWVVQDENAQTVYRNAFEYIRVRGNYSFYPYKKSFHIKLYDGAKILDMDSAKTWLLIANYCDNSLLRNALTYDLAAAVGMDYTIDYRFADVYVNTTYYGTYLLTEKVQVGKNRVNIADLEEATEDVNTKELSSFKRLGTTEYRRGVMKYSGIENNPEDITGGYLMQIELEERYKEAPSGFVTKNGQVIHLKSPEYASKEQVTYISSFVQSFENAISAADGIDPDTGKHFSEIADMESLVSKYLIEEISKNLDGNKSSFYLYKYPDSVSDKLYFGPVWDYDIAYGNYQTSYYKKELTNPENLLVATDDYEKYYWFPKLYQHADFVDAVKAMYKERFRPCLEVILGQAEPSEATGNVMSLADYEAMLTAAAGMNFSRWRIFNADEFPVETGADYPANIEYLRAFLTQRMAYLDSIWLAEE